MPSIKLTYACKDKDPEVRRFSGEYTFENLQALFEHLFDMPARWQNLEYEDDENDRIRISSQVEWEECVRLFNETPSAAARQPLRMILQRLKVAREERAPLVLSTQSPSVQQLVTQPEVVKTEVTADIAVPTVPEATEHGGSDVTTVFSYASALRKNLASLPVGTGAVVPTSDAVEAKSTETKEEETTATVTDNATSVPQLTSNRRNFPQKDKKKRRGRETVVVPYVVPQAPMTKTVTPSTTTAKRGNYYAVPLAPKDKLDPLFALLQLFPSMKLDHAQALLASSKNDADYAAMTYLQYLDSLDDRFC